VSEKILVVGGGTMGAGIAACAAAAGFGVTLIESDAARRDALRLQLPGSIEVLAEIAPSIDAAVAIEAVPERLDLKRAIVANLCSSLPANALVATNTSSLSVGDIARDVASAQRVLGLHFFNPPEKMRLVEIVAAEQTSQEVIDRAAAFVEALGKTGVVTEDTPGFIVNRVARPYYLQAMQAIERGIASVEECDELARGIGFRMGPFELMDVIGLDVNLATTTSIYERTLEERLAPADMQRAMVRGGRLGRKSGNGFYAYPPGPDRRDEAPPMQERNADESIVLVGFGAIADELAEALEGAYEHVARIENDEMIEELLDPSATIVIDVGDGSSDRSPIVKLLDRIVPPETVILVDAYANDVDAVAKRATAPERIVGYGIVASVSGQRTIEVAGAEGTADDMLGLAAELFEAMGKRVIVTLNGPGLFLGRVVASIVNEAVLAVDEGIASAADVDIAMQLGTNYPLGPIAWGGEIGSKRIVRILSRLAAVEGEKYAPFRALWVLDVEEHPDESAASGMSAYGV
jgi:3-hydroxybutyryl-CoA dehydrogenase